MIFQAAIPKGLCIPIALEIGALNHDMNLIASKTMFAAPCLYLESQTVM
jgi:hypothetical protein